MSDLILALNCGSSSIKSALFDAATLPRDPCWRGEVAGIGNAAAVFEESGAKPQPLAASAGDPYRAALAHIRERVRDRHGRRVVQPFVPGSVGTGRVMHVRGHDPGHRV